ncbi:MAG: WYL domain-containing protein [Desulfobacterales bacterium]
MSFFIFGWVASQTKKNGKTILTFCASSEPELASWILSFGDEAKIIKPDWLVENVKSMIDNMSTLF